MRKLAKIAAAKLSPVMRSMAGFKICLAQLPCTAASVVAQHLQGHTGPVHLLAVGQLCGNEGFLWEDPAALAAAVRAWVLAHTFRHEWSATRRLLRAHSPRVDFGCLLHQWLRHCDDYPADAGDWLHTWMGDDVRWCAHCTHRVHDWLRAHPPTCPLLQNIFTRLESRTICCNFNKLVCKHGKHRRLVFKP